MEHKKFCVYVSESPITAIKVETKEDAEEIQKISCHKYIVTAEVTFNS